MPNESKTNRQSLQSVHDKAGINTTNIRPFKNAFEGKGKLDNLPPHVEKFEDRKKAEVNALIAIFIEEIWMKTLEEIKLHPPGIIDTFGNPLTKVQVTDKLSYAKDSKAVANFLITRIKLSLVRQLSEWLEIREKAWRDRMGMGDDIKEKAFDRYKKLLMIDGVTEPLEQIRGGILTAINTTWGIIKVLPKVYEQQFQTSMQSDKFEKLAQNSLPLIYTLASSSLRVFLAMQWNFSKSEQQLIDSEEVSDFHPERFTFRTSGEELYLELKPEFIEEAQPLSLGGDVRTGCPALYTTGPNRKNIIAEIFDWEIELAKEYYLPVLEREQKVV